MELCFGPCIPSPFHLTAAPRARPISNISDRQKQRRGMSSIVQHSPAQHNTSQLVGFGLVLITLSNSCSAFLLFSAGLLGTPTDTPTNSLSKFAW